LVAPSDYISFGFLATHQFKFNATAHRDFLGRDLVRGDLNSRQAMNLAPQF
jgi:hypothetical protein